MTSIDDTTHGEQDEEDEYETVWVPPFHMAEVFLAQQRLGDLQRDLENAARIQAVGVQVENPALLMLQGADKLAAFGEPAALQELRRIEEQNRRMLGHTQVRRRKQRSTTPITRQLPERPSTPLQREYVPPVAPSQTNIEPSKRKRGPGRLPGETFNSMEEVRDTLLRLTSDNRKAPSQRLVARSLPLPVSVDAVQDYATNWFGGWPGVKRMCAAHLCKVEAEESSAGRDN